jgi:hypothetical protein
LVAGKSGDDVNAIALINPIKDFGAFVVRENNLEGGQKV